jgi:hypothetical protein
MSLQKPLARCHRHSERILIVIAGVILPPAIEEHVLVIGGARSWIIHIEPCSLDTAANKPRHFPGPPLPGRPQRKVWKNRLSGPNQPDEFLSLRIQVEGHLLAPALVDVVGLVELYARINDGHNFAPISCQSGNRILVMRKMLTLEGENTVSAHVIDIQPQTIHRNSVFAKFAIQPDQITL